MSKELVDTKSSQFITKELIDQITGGSVQASDMPRIKAPTPLSKLYMLPSVEGEKPVKTFSGVILHAQRVRGYWTERYSGDNAPPACSSWDCVTGAGSPGGDCVSCPNNVWGSARDEKGNASAGKLCRESFMLIISLPGSIMPVKMTCAPTSIKSIQGYLLALAGTNKPYWHVETEFSFAESKTKTGQASTVIKARMSKALDEESLSGYNDRHFQAAAMIGSLKQDFAE